MEEREDEEFKCANPQCKCTVQREGGYCGEHCRTAADRPESECRCGHPDCA